VVTGLSAHLEDYLALRRGLGFKLERPGRLLEDFVGYLEQAGAATVTSEHALAWATAPGGADPAWWHGRLAAVRPFARYLAPRIAGTEVPPRGLLPGPASRRAVPYLYSDAEVAALVAATAAIRTPFRAATYRALIGLLAVTGMRIGEAIGLDCGDLDAGQGLMTIRSGKFGKSRQLPLHSSALEALTRYARLRDSAHRHPAAPAFLLSAAGTRLIYKNVNRTFRKLAGAAGLRPRSAACRPRIHDLRHTFAVTTLTRWYADGGDVAARLPLLSTWLGHAAPADTYWYLTGTPELLALAAARLAGPEGDQR
jgi:integrase/recombinase XerD